MSPQASTVSALLTQSSGKQTSAGCRCPAARLQLPPVSTRRRLPFHQPGKIFRHPGEIDEGFAALYLYEEACRLVRGWRLKDILSSKPARPRRHAEVFG